MKVLFIAAEVAPIAKVGGLADVTAGLPKALRSLGHDVRLILPRYASLEQSLAPLADPVARFEVLADRGPEPCGLYATELNRVPLYLVDNERLLRRDQIYGYPDDLDRFIFFARAALESGRQLEWRPDIVHTHDWHTGIVGPWLHFGQPGGGFYGASAVVFTIHNLAFQGWFDEGFRRRFDLVPAFAVDEPTAGVDMHSTVALAVRFSDAINTVSETYAREILTPEFGNGLDPLLSWRRERLSGIVNGIDYEVFDPEGDPRIAAHYSGADLRPKAENKRVLQVEAGLEPDPGTMLVGMVSRLFDQKGVDLVAQVMPELLAQERVQFVLLGAGEERYHRFFSKLAQQFPGRVAAYLTFDAALAERIYAGADLFLMPSRFEPCGLGQLIALRYGTVPLVRETGGLADTVEDLDPGGIQGTGFVFRAYRANALRGALLRALDAYRSPPLWDGLVRRGMARDVSWTASARRYERLYNDALDFHARETQTQ